MPAGSTLGGKGASVTPSPSRQARTSISWISAVVPRSQDEGYAGSLLPLSSFYAPEWRPQGFREGLPTIVYFFTAKDDDKLLKFDATVFGDERVGVSARFFNCLRVSLDAMSPADRKAWGGDQPTVVVLDSKGQTAKRFDGWATSGAGVFKSLEVTFKERYDLNLAGLLAKEARILDTLDKVYWELLDLQEDMKQKQEHLAKHDCEPGRKAVKEIEDDMAKLEKERTKAIEDEQKLLEAPAKAAVSDSASSSTN